VRFVREDTRRYLPETFFAGGKEILTPRDDEDEDEDEDFDVVETRRIEIF